MEVVIPVPATDFHFDSNSSSPYITAPSSPKRFGDFFYFSAPTSPTRISSIYNQFNSIETNTTPSSPSSIPFDWEEKPGKPKSRDAEHDPESNYDFAFDFSGQLDKPPLTAAEELFDHGKIRPLKPPPRLQLGFGDEPRKSPVSSPKRIFRNAFSPRSRKDVDPFAAAIEETRKGSDGARGRERGPGVGSSSPIRRGTRSLSPFRVSDSNPKSSSASSSSSLKGGSRKWRLKDFLLFRSASEGRATDKDPLRKYALLSKKGSEDAKNASFRSTDSSGSVSSSRRIGTVSAHELHYTANRAVSEEQKKKTFLPYRQGLLGCLGFNPSGSGLAKGFDSLTRVRW
ncbi:hypothetical protein MRB53_033626 [Persea americana]|uniref:Uncharacterized protein n=1 Tax=Persea americana TaxID=3435 RepID=A0ACC2KVC1_PERAE|nr:hypothetical protein MRB53_033626 [Persea americana]